ncbi:MAG: HK97 family phage prohead protease [Sphingobacteriia bacterium]|nr:HK97 family phage prohead protease [Sphingobacteriia bacterium]
MKPQREFKSKILELKNPGKFIGYASVFDIIDQNHDIILPGAFKHTLKNKNLLDVKLLWQHNPNQPIGRINKLLEDNYGLFIEAELILSLTQAKEAYTLIKEKIVVGLSIGYKIKSSYFNKKIQKRVITELDLFEISLVTFPANPKALINEVKNNNNSPLLSLSFALANAIQILSTNKENKI